MKLRKFSLGILAVAGGVLAAVGGFAYYDHVQQSRFIEQSKFIDWSGLIEQSHAHSGLFIEFDIHDFVISADIEVICHMGPYARLSSEYGFVAQIV